MVLHDPGRGAHDQELQVSTMEYFAHVSLVPAVAPHWHSASKQSDGAVGVAQVLDVWNGLCRPQRVCRVVRK